MAALIWLVLIDLTSCDVVNRTAPRGTKITPITMKAGMTVFAVITGCHAGSLCCLNAESEKKKIHKFYCLRQSVK